MPDPDTGKPADVMRVFISSTNEDLREYRTAARDAAISAGFYPDMQEYFKAGTTVPLKVCLDKVKSADVVVAIVAHRYGWVPEDQPGNDRKSITWLECEAANEVLAFLVDEDYPWPDRLKESAQLMVAAEKGEFTAELGQTVQANVSRLREFKAWLSEIGIRQVFTTPDDLRGKVESALREWREVKVGGGGGGAGPLPPTPRPEKKINLPPPGAGRSFRNREQEISVLKTHLQDPDIRLTCVVGPVGVGKTALVARLCEQIENGEFRISQTSRTMGVDGIVYFVCRGGGRLTSERLFDEVGRLLDEQADKEVTDYWADGTRDDADKFAFLLSKLRGHGLLLVVDNFEAALDQNNNRIGDESLATFVDVCLTTRQPLRLLVTSREWISLNMEAERARRNVELTKGLPKPEAIAMLRDLDPERDLGLDRMPTEVLEKTVTRCGCIPSALQRVVGMLRDDLTLSLPDLLKDEASFPTGVEDLVAKQYARQSEDRQRVLQALAVYNKPVKHDAVSHLLAAFSFDIKVGECLTGLKRNYLVERSPERGTFELPPSVQEYAYKEIPDRGEGYTKRACHASAADYYFTQRLPEEQRKAIEDLRPQMDEFDQRILAGQYDEAARLLDLIDQDYLQPWGHFRTVVTMRDQLVDKLTDPNLLQSHFGSLGLMYRRTGRLPDAPDCFQQAIDHAESAGDKKAMATWCCELGNTYADLVEMERALEQYERGLAIAEENEDLPGQSRLLGVVAIARRQLGDASEALTCYERAIEIDWKMIEQAPDAEAERAAKRSLALHLGNSAKPYIALGDAAKAIEVSEEAIRLLHEVNYPFAEAAFLEHIGEAEVLQGSFQAAWEHFQQSVGLLEAMGETRSTSYSLDGLGCAYQHLGDRANARARYERARKLKVPETCFHCEVMLGILDLEEADRESAGRRLAAGIDQCRELLRKTPHYYEAIYRLALAMLANREKDAALPTYEEALAVCNAAGEVRIALKELSLLRRAAPDTPGLDEAQRLLEAALAEPDGP